MAQRVWDSGLPSLQVDCSEYRRLEQGRPIYCERLYQPFCGSDGKTYNNKCSFCKAVLWVLSWAAGTATPQNCWAPLGLVPLCSCALPLHSDCSSSWSCATDLNNKWWWLLGESFLFWQEVWNRQLKMTQIFGSELPIPAGIVKLDTKKLLGYLCEQLPIPAGMVKLNTKKLLGYSCEQCPILAGNIK